MTLVYDSNDKALKKLTIGFMKMMADNQPDLFNEVLDKHCKSEIEKEVLRLRYIKDIKFELIPELLSQQKSLRYVFLLHNKFISEVVYCMLSSLEIA